MIFRKPDRPPDSGPPAMARSWQPLRIAARGMCCAVGHDARAATAAINARLNHFRETGFFAGGVPLNGAALFGLDVWGSERLLHMLRAVLDEAWANADGADPADTALTLALPGHERPGWSQRALADVQARLVDGESAVGRRYAAIAMQACGKGGIAETLEGCAALLGADGGPRHVMLASVDSLLNAATIEHFLAQERLLTHTNADGMIPAEGAAALLLDRRAESPGVWIDAVAAADEAWRIDGEMPMRAQGLAQAIRAAAAFTGQAVADLDFHASGMTGESWYAKETSLALSRCIERRTPSFPHLMIARSLGETGAASPALTLAWLAGIMLRPHGSPGRKGLLHFAGDDGRRSALILQARS